MINELVNNRFNELKQYNCTSNNFFLNATNNYFIIVWYKILHVKNKYYINIQIIIDLGNINLKIK